MSLLTFDLSVISALLWWERRRQDCEEGTEKEKISRFEGLGGQSEFERLCNWKGDGLEAVAKGWKIQKILEIQSMAEDQEKILQDAKKLPYEARVAHKSWAVKAAAFEDIGADCKKALDPKDDIFHETGEPHSTVSADFDAYLEEFCKMIF